MEKTTAEILEAFATALDIDDYEAAGALLDPQCKYEQPGKSLEGCQAVLKSFSDNSEWAHANLEKIVFVHSIENCRNNAGTIRFVDRIEHAGKHSTYECLMHASLNDRGVIRELILEELPGQKEAVAKFLASVGISR